MSPKKAQNPCQLVTGRYRAVWPRHVPVTGIAPAAGALERMGNGSSVPRVRMRGMRKSFGSIEALRGVDLDRHQLALGPGFCLPDLGTVIRNSGSSSPPRTIWRLPEPMSISATRSWRVQAWRCWPAK